jgi:hypothetical protein
MILPSASRLIFSTHLAPIFARSCGAFTLAKLDRQLDIRNNIPEDSDTK